LSYVGLSGQIIDHASPSFIIPGHNLVTRHPSFRYVPYSWCRARGADAVPAGVDDEGDLVSAP